MPDAARPRLGLQAIAGSDAANTIDTTSDAAMDIIDAQAAIFSQGVFGSRPTSTAGTPGITGRFYYATDTVQLFYDIGTAWVELPVALVPLAKLAIAPMARVYNSANISIPNNTNTALTFNTERYDTAALHSTASLTSRFTVATAGVYRVGAHVQWAGNPGGGEHTLYLRRNGSTIVAGDTRTLSESGPRRQSIASEVLLAAADYVEVLAFQASGVALNVLAGAEFSPEFWISFAGRAV